MTTEAMRAGFLERSRGMTEAAKLEFDPETCITAGELRSMGISVPSSVPDCGWVRRSSILRAYVEPRTVSYVEPRIPADENVLSITYQLSFTEEFKWVTVNLTVSPTEKT